MTTFTFTTRETYLAYVAEWKQKYAAQSIIQRQLKQAIKVEARKSGWPWKEEHEYLAGKATARELLEERAASKEEAGRQWALKNTSLVP